jgi:two-component system response regulator HupR/HoxA
MNEVCARVSRVAPYDVSVLLIGESGTGKELIARALHYNSLRWDKPFVVENCAALPDELLESELFGYKRGAFTGATEDRIGMFERANGGTVFLDEIGEVSPAFQVKLLRVLQEREIRPLGSGRTRQVDVRVVAATNKDMETEVREGRFREDLYYRLATVTVQLPPLRERIEDIPVLAHALLENSIESLGKRVQGFTNEALACMQAYHWPGNIRELQNEIRHMLVMSDGNYLGAELLTNRVLYAAPEEAAGAMSLLAEQGGSLKERIEMLEARILKETLIRHRWNKSRAAKELGLSRVGLRNKLERYGLERVGDSSGNAKPASSAGAGERSAVSYE